MNFLTSEIVKYAHRMDAKGFSANHDGNITVKQDNTFLATPTAISKANMTEDLVITLDQSGNKISGNGKSFSEIKLHLAAYKARPEAKAVVHAHPPFATARGLVNLPLRPALPEAVVSIGALVPVVEFSLPGTIENEQLVSSAFLEFDVIMLAGNGVLAIGDSIEQAFLRLELVEHLAKIDYYTRLMGSSMELSNSDVLSLLEKRKAAGLGPKTEPKTPLLSEKKNTDSLKDLIAEELKKILVK
ncbi:MAG: class II aldolase/adducin family protein [Gammaproteobacteria bacterium]